MNLCDINEINSLLREHGFRFSRSMGQNFLVAPWVPERIARESKADKNTCVLEIGPGVGCLTEKLSLLAGKVVSVELDKRLLPVLEETLEGKDNVELINADIMKLDIGELIDERFCNMRPIVCANLPYNITSPVLTKLIELKRFDYITVMVQKEMAQRIVAVCGSKEYGAFSLLVQYYTEPELLFDVPNTCFEPRPKVTSSVVRFKNRERPPVNTDSALLFKVIRAAFNQRRKTLVNALYAAFTDLTKDELLGAVVSAGLKSDVRGEALTLEEFARVAENVGWMRE